MDDLEGALEAAEATISRQTEVDYLLVADRAEVVNGKLYLMGGGWDRLQPPSFPHRLTLGIALGVRIPVFESEDQHVVDIDLLHEDKRILGFQAKLATGRPAGLRGMDLVVPMAFNVPVVIPGPGQLVLRAGVDGRAPRRHEIRALTKA
jgi:hypothetical protein